MRFLYVKFFGRNKSSTKLHKLFSTNSFEKIESLHKIEWAFPLKNKSLKNVQPRFLAKNVI